MEDAISSMTWKPFPVSLQFHPLFFPPYRFTIFFPNFARSCLCFARHSLALGVFAYLLVANPRKGRIRKSSLLHKSHKTSFLPPIIPDTLNPPTGSFPHLYKCGNRRLRIKAAINYTIVCRQAQCAAPNLLPPQIPSSQAPAKSQNNKFQRKPCSYGSRLST